MKPLVSIIMPVFNSENFLSKSISSVLNQTYKNWELIIIDDGSQDRSKDIAENYEKSEKRIRLITTTGGLKAAGARNIGIDQSKGEFIAFLDSDDLWDSKKLEIQIDHMIKNDYHFTYTNYCHIDEEDNILRYIETPKTTNYKYLLSQNIIGCLTVVYKKKVFDSIRMPMETKREDYATWLSMLKIIPTAYAINENLAYYRLHKNQSSSKKLSMAIENWKLYRKVEKLSLINSIIFFISYAKNSIFKYHFKK